MWPTTPRRGGYRSGHPHPRALQSLHAQAYSGCQQAFRTEDSWPSFPVIRRAISSGTPVTSTSMWNTRRQRENSFARHDLIPHT
jgi:hypothetical protein